MKAPVFFLENSNFAHFLPVFKLKKCPFFARFFLKMSPFEEFFTLMYYIRLFLSKYPIKFMQSGSGVTVVIGTVVIVTVVIVRVASDCYCFRDRWIPVFCTNRPLQTRREFVRVFDEENRKDI